MRYKIRTTARFDAWLKSLKDRQALKAIVMRLTRVETGNLGDVKSLGGEIGEMRIFAGKGYRLYFTIRGGNVIFLLIGGNKASQQENIETAKRMNREV